MIFFIGCCYEEGHQEPVVTYLTGEWYCTTESIHVEFTKDSQFKLQSERGNIVLGDYYTTLYSDTIINEDTLFLYCPEFETEDYEGDTCIIKCIDETTIYVKDLPYYKNEQIKLLKNINYDR